LEFVIGMPVDSWQEITDVMILCVFSNFFGFARCRKVCGFFMAREHALKEVNKQR